MAFFPLALLLVALQVPQDPVLLPGGVRRAPRWIEVVETGLAVLSFDLAEGRGRFAPFIVRESLQGADLTGDGDTADAVLHVLDLREGTVLALPHLMGSADGGLVPPGSLPRVVEERIAVQISEELYGFDLNDDGDLLDSVAGVLDLATGVLHSSGLSANVVVSNHPWAALAVSELDHGDLDGNGVIGGRVAHAWNVDTGEITNVGLPVTQGMVTNGSSLLFRVHEPAVGEDRNGDGDLLDVVLHVYEAATGELFNTGLAAVQADVRDGMEVIPVFEFSQGADLNGDGDPNDLVTYLYHKPTQTVRLLPFALGPHAIPTGHGGSASGPLLAVAGERVLIVVDENQDGAADLNGDGDAVDHVGLLHELATNQNTVLGAVWNFALEGDLVVHEVYEVQEGADLNGDEDAEDWVLHVLDATTGATTNLGLATPPRHEPIWGFDSLDFDGTRIAFHVREDSQGADLDGDGDLCDFVLFVHDAASGLTTNSGLAAHGASVRWCAGQVLLGVQEGNDCVFTPQRLRLVAWDPATGRTRNARILVSTIGPAFGSHAAVLSAEGVEGADLNGDGDQNDVVLRVVRIQG